MWWTIVPQEIITKTWIMGLSIWNYHGIVIVFGWTNLHVVRSCWLDGLADNSALHIISHRKLGNVALSLPRHRVDAVYLQADELLSPSERFLTRRSHADSQQGPIRCYIKFSISCVEFELSPMSIQGDAAQGIGCQWWCRRKKDQLDFIRGVVVARFVGRDEAMSMHECIT